MRRILEVEFLKLKNSRVLLMAVLAPAFMVFQGVVNFLRYYELFTSRGQDVWRQIYLQSTIFYVSALLPVLITLIAAGIARIEFKSGGLRYFLTLPIKKSGVYASKLLLTCAVCLLNVLVFSLSLLLAGKLVRAPGPVAYGLVLGRPFLAYVASLPVIGFNFILNLNLSQMGIPLIAGVGLALPSLLVANTRYWAFYPWTYPIMAALGGDFFESTYFPLAAGPAIFAVLTLGGLHWFAKKDWLD